MNENCYYHNLVKDRLEIQKQNMAKILNVEDTSSTVSSIVPLESDSVPLKEITQNKYELILI